MKYAGRIILASASPRRRELLERAGVPFDVRVADVSEDADVSAPPERLAVSNAELKASRVARENAERLVLGADTVVYRNSKIYGKPRDIADTKRMLAELRGGAHSVFTGVCAAYFDGAELRTKTACGESRVHFKSLDADAISEYVSKVDVLDKAGAYAAQECGSMIIEKIDGDFDNVMGLPVALAESTLDMLAAELKI